MAWASLIIAMMLWGSSFVGAKFALQSFTPEQAVGIRLALAVVTCLGYSPGAAGTWQK